MVLSEFQEAGLIFALLKQKFEKEIEEAREEGYHKGYRDARQLHTEDVAMVPEPRPVLEKCFRQAALTLAWYNNLHESGLETVIAPSFRGRRSAPSLSPAPADSAPHVRCCRSCAR